MHRPVQYSLKRLVKLCGAHRGTHLSFVHSANLISFMLYPTVWHIRRTLIKDTKA